MYFNIYLDDQTASKLNQATKASSDSRNAIIRKAIVLWLNMTNKTEWSKEISDFQGIDDFQNFENNRFDLKAPKDDPKAHILPTTTSKASL